MGYETRIHVVSKYTFREEPPMGQELAMIDLSKCGYDGPLEALMKKYRRNSKEGGKPTFALYARNPERQQEAVEVLRKVANNVEKHGNEEKAKYLKKLSNHIEDGTITTDCYGDFLSVIPIDEFITALEEELRVNEPYRRFQWALVLLKSIRDTWDEGHKEDLAVVTFGH